MGKKRFGIQTNNNCNRWCSNCFVEATPSGPTLKFIKIKEVISQIAEIVLSDPTRYSPTITLTGGEVLQYQDGNYLLGDIVDLIHDNGLRFILNTRGLTTQEQKKDMIAYKNFLGLRSRFPRDYEPQIEISFDTYTFNNQGDGEVGKDMARNSITGFKEIGANIFLHTTTSVERAARTYTAVKELMAMIGYEFSAEQNLNPELPFQTAEAIGRNIVDRLRRNARAAAITYGNEEGDLIPVFFYDISLDGRGSTLKETPMRPFYDCFVAMDTTESYLVRYDMGVTACCRNNCNLIPAIGYLSEDTLRKVIDKFNQYSQAARNMREATWRSLEKQKRDICTICASELPKYLAQIGS